MKEYGEITLVSKTYEQDCIGQPVEREKERRTIPCSIESVGRNEWITAMQGGFQADILCKIFTASYQNETEAILHNARYTIYRTYRVGDQTELYLATRVSDLP